MLIECGVELAYLAVFTGPFGGIVGLTVVAREDGGKFAEQSADELVERVELAQDGRTFRVERYVVVGDVAERVEHRDAWTIFEKHVSKPTDAVLALRLVAYHSLRVVAEKVARRVRFAPLRPTQRNGRRGCGR